MRITLFSAGSRGDIQPCQVLGRALVQAGVALRFAAPENFAGFIQAEGLDFLPLRGDIQQIMAGQAARDLMERGGGNPLRTLRGMRALIEPVATVMAEDLYAGCEGADGLVALAVFAPLAHTVAQARRIPLLLVEPTPLLPTRAFPAPGWPLQKNLGGLHNRFSGWAMLQIIWQWYAPTVHRLRRKWGLPRFSGADFPRLLRSTPLLGAYSPAVLPRPADWPPGAHITGYWLPAADPDWQPPADLRAFLDSGEPPVYIGFGSMAGSRPEQMAALVIDALARCGRRGVLMTGWGGLRLPSTAEHVFALESAPHAWLFPHMAAVVHHGGAGTTAEGIRAGVPSILIPHAFDQTFWGERVKALGVGPAPIAQRDLTAPRLAQAIHTALTDEPMRRRAQALGGLLRAEDGPARAARLILDLLAR